VTAVLACDAAVEGVTGHRDHAQKLPSTRTWARATVYNYFESKDDFAMAVLEAMMHDPALGHWTERGLRGFGSNEPRHRRGGKS
jgi:uncharacterized MAPEG superfamily protein